LTAKQKAKALSNKKYREKIRNNEDKKKLYNQIDVVTKQIKRLIDYIEKEKKKTVPSEVKLTNYNLRFAEKLKEKEELQKAYKMSKNPDEGGEVSQNTETKMSQNTSSSVGVCIERDGQGYEITLKGFKQWLKDSAPRAGKPPRRRTGQMDKNRETKFEKKTQSSEVEVPEELQVPEVPHGRRPNFNFNS